jgi:hypothetical protein
VGRWLYRAIYVLIRVIHTRLEPNALPAIYCLAHTKNLTHNRKYALVQNASKYFKATNNYSVRKRNSSGRSSCSFSSQSPNSSSLLASAFSSSSAARSDATLIE